MQRDARLGLWLSLALTLFFVPSPLWADSTGYLQGTKREKQKEMRRISKLLGYKCTACHDLKKSKDFSKNQHGKAEEARWMMELSVTHAVTCDFCHAKTPKGAEKLNYTEKGKIAEVMIAWAMEHGKPCTACHGKKFELTEAGKKAKAEKNYPIYEPTHPAAE
ncbi:MAG: hypothetical protein D6795_01425 [Deltaproteobacteria bacterium]|nr:MAG: hypothetical protein D6795_01425 [Deltaproteobacteria bacterium]